MAKIPTLKSRAFHVYGGPEGRNITVLMPDGTDITSLITGLTMEVKDKILYGNLQVICDTNTMTFAPSEVNE